MTDTGKCPAFGYDCEYVAKVEAQAAEIERLLDYDEAKANALHNTLNQLANAEQEIERLDRLLVGSYTFIVWQGLWNEFVDQLPCAALGEVK